MEKQTGISLLVKIESSYLTQGKDEVDRNPVHLLKSKTFSKIEDPQAGLYYQSPVYVFDMLKEEFA